MPLPFTPLNQSCAECLRRFTATTRLTQMNGSPSACHYGLHKSANDPLIPAERPSLDPVHASLPLFSLVCYCQTPTDYNLHVKQQTCSNFMQHLVLLSTHLRCPFLWLNLLCFWLTPARPTPGCCSTGATVGPRAQTQTAPSWPRVPHWRPPLHPPRPHLVPAGQLRCCRPPHHQTVLEEQQNTIMT